MVNWLILISLVLCFLVTFLILPLWIKKAKENGFVSRDMNKIGGEKVADSGGIIVILGFLTGLFFYIAFRTFYLYNREYELELFATISVILLMTLLGNIDRMIGWKTGIKQSHKFIICLIASIPLVVINAGHSEINIPFFGLINVGLIYPLILIPIAISGASNGFNILAGYNGLEASMGIIILSAIGIVSYTTGSRIVAVICFCMVFSLCAFLIFNWYPAKVFPGDALTYSVGALIAISAILGNFERIALFFFVPYIIEGFLKLRGKLKMESFGIPKEDGSLDVPHKKFYGLEHISLWVLKKIKGKAYEWEVVYLLCGFEILIIILGFLIFKIF